MARQTKAEAREATLTRKRQRADKVRVTQVDWDALSRELQAVAR